LKDEYRRQRGRHLVSIEDDQVVDSADPHAEAAASESEAQLRAGLLTLPRLQREVFLMRAQQGCEYGEIAAALGTTPGAARVHYHHAVRRLKELVS
jgi:RNA polymerase sigma-70 factor (ECF subfamily)